MSKVLVVFHASCADGFCAAWLLHRVYPDAEYHAAHYGTEPPDVRGKQVFIVDFSYKRDVLEKIHFEAESLIVLDHHKTAEEELKGLDYCTFDMNKSGGRLTWEWGCKNTPLPMGSGISFGYDRAGRVANDIENAPWLVDYTEDRDLWKFELDMSKSVSAALRSYQMEFEEWDAIADDPGSLSRMKNEGMAILRYQDQIVEGAVKHATEVEFDGHKVLCTNSTTLISEIAGKLAEDRPFGVCWFERSDGCRVYSLRSRDGGIDVSEIAKTHGGGGHRNAAGFEVPIGVDRPDQRI